MGMSNLVSTSVRDNMRRQTEGRTQTKEKADRATVEQVVFAPEYDVHSICLNCSLYR